MRWRVVVEADICTVFVEAETELQAKKEAEKAVAKNMTDYLNPVAIDARPAVCQSLGVINREAIKGGE